MILMNILLYFDHQAEALAISAVFWLRAAVAIVLLASLRSPACAWEGCERCLVAYGDSRSGHKQHEALVQRLVLLKPEVVVHAGDMVAKGKRARDWERFEGIIAPLRPKAEIFPAIGNHDAGGLERLFKLLPGLEGKRWYERTRRGVRFLFLDSLAPLAKGAAQRSWLEAALKAKSSKAGYLVVTIHEPLMSSGRHGPANFAPELMPLLEAGGVDLVLSGHDHDYERLEKDGVSYVVTGGGGAPLYEKRRENPFTRAFSAAHHFVALSPGKEKLVVEAFDLEGKSLDRFEVSRKGARSAP